MTVTVAPPINTSTANGVTTTFPFNFRVQQHADLRVTVNGLGRTEGVHYEITDNPDQVNTPGGSVIFQPGYVPVSGDIVTRRRLMAFERSTNYVNLGDLLAATLNADQDAPIMMIQQLASLALQLIEDGDGGFVWDAQNNRIIHVGSGIDTSDAANLGNVLTMIEQYINGGSTTGVRPQKWDILGNGENTDFVLSGADVDEPLLYLACLDGELLEPYDGFTIIQGDSPTQRIIRFPTAPTDGVEGFVILNGYARPWTGPQPITSLAVTVRSYAGTAETLDTSAHHSLIVTSSNSAVTESIRVNTGAGNDWARGQFFSVHQGGTGQVTIALAGAGTLKTPTGFNAKTRGQNSVITATCEDPDTNTWLLSGDLERAASAPDLQVIQIRDMSVLVGTNIATGTSKASFIMPYGFLLESVANRGIYASLTVAQAAGSVVTVDVNRNGTSLISTKLTFDNNEKDTGTAAIPAVYAANGDVLFAGDEITIDVDQIGTALAKGLTVCLVGRRAS